MRKRAVSSPVWRQDFAPLSRDEGFWESPPRFLGHQRVRINWCRKASWTSVTVRQMDRQGALSLRALPFRPGGPQRRGFSASLTSGLTCLSCSAGMWPRAAWALREVWPDPCCVSSTSRANGGPVGGAGRPLELSQTALSGAAALRRGDVCKGRNSQASGGPGVIFKRSNATPQNHRKSGFSWKGHAEVSVLISKRHLLPAVEAALLETER